MEKFGLNEAPQFTSPEEELRFLREQIAIKEKALEKTGTSIDKVQATHTTVAEYKKLPTQEVLHPSLQIPEKHQEQIVLDLAPETHDVKMAELLAILQEKGVKNTLALVDKMQNPHIEDDFHRFLVEYLRKGYPVSDLKEKAPIFKALNMVLYEIALPALPARGTTRRRGLRRERCPPSTRCRAGRWPLATSYPKSLRRPADAPDGAPALSGSESGSCRRRSATTSVRPAGSPGVSAGSLS